MRTKFADSVHGATTFRRVSVFEKPQAPEQERKLPSGVDGWLRGFGLSCSEMYAAGQRFTTAQINAHFAGRNTKLADRMSVKSTLAQFNLLENS